MAQVLEFKLPDLGEGLTEAEIVRWLVSVGDVVAIDQPVVEVETAKAMVEVPCPYGGVVTARFGEEGAELPVGAPLLTVAVGATDGGPGPDSGAAASAPAGSSAGSSSAGSSGPAPGGADESSGNVLVGYGTGAPAARRRRIRPSAPGARAAAPAERPVAAASAPAAPAASAPAASPPVGSGPAARAATAATGASAAPASAVLSSAALASA
ncbi:biotin/lipoyl-containing protein, partial [Streptomyces sp. NPDC055078]